MKAFYAAEEMEKRAKRTQMTTTSLQDLGYRKKAASAGSSRGESFYKSMLDDLGANGYRSETDNTAG